MKDKLVKACKEAFIQENNNCSGAVKYVIRKMLGDEVFKKIQYMSANMLLEYFKNNWKTVLPIESQRFANKGIVVVAGSASSPNGHVVIVYPGNMKTRGGYTYKRDGKIRMVRIKGSYPLAMSTSMGRWPGAKSNGDKTVWDPWGKDSAYEKVKYYKKFNENDVA